MLRYNRGSIWWTDLPTIINESLTDTSVQSGKRPCIVVSNNVNNIHSTTVNICPITTSIDNLPIHPTIYTKQKSQVLTEQIRTIDRRMLTGYIGQATDKEMEDIEIALSLQLGLQGNNLDNDILQQLKFIELALTSIEEHKVKETFNQVQKDAEIKKVMTHIEQKVGKYRGMSQVEKFEARYPQTKKENSTTPESKATGKRKYRTWTLQEKTNFVSDYHKLTREELMKKYELNSVSNVYTCYARFTKELQNA